MIFYKTVTIGSGEYAEARKQIEVSLNPMYEDTSGDDEHLYMFSHLLEMHTKEVDQLTTDICDESETEPVYVRFENF